MSIKNGTKRTYWPKEMDDWIVQYQQMEDGYEKDKFFQDYLYQPFDDLAKSVFFSFGRGNRNIQADWKTMIDTMCSEGVSKISQYDAARSNNSFSYFTVVIRNFLFRINMSAEKTRNILSLDSLISNDSENDSGNLYEILNTTNIWERSNIVDEEFMQYCKDWWLHHYEEIFPKKYIFSNIGHIVLDVMFHHKFKNKEEFLTLIHKKFEQREDRAARPNYIGICQRRIKITHAILKTYWREGKEPPKISFGTRKSEDDETIIKQYAYREQ